jgi:hypothetical protein
MKALTDEEVRAMVKTLSDAHPDLDFIIIAVNKEGDTTLLSTLGYSAIPILQSAADQLLMRINDGKADPAQN